jgi:DNA-binding SARP family transcriptional activator
MSGDLEECRFGVLGPVQVMTTNGPVRFSRRQQLDLLALLLLHADRVLSIGMVVDAMWGQAAPRTATAQIKNMVSVLRRTLVDGHQILASIDRQVAGYRLHVTDGQLDLDRFTVLLAETKAAATPDTVVSKLRRALGLWRGAHALAGVRADYADAARTHLQEMRSAALEDMFDAELECANHARIVPELTRAVEDHPGRERLVGQLMVALYRTGRAADALGVYRKARQILTNEYGLEPSTGLRDLERQILRGEPVPGRPRSVSVGVSIADQPSSETDTVPLQLPLDVFGFVGRHAELATLDRLLDDQRRQPRTVVISAVGMPGVGKTALAVHWAHKVADRFPDGQLYVNLRGFGPGSPMSPAEAVRGFLDALAVAPKRVPVGVPAQAAHFRSLVAGRRMLVVLDNAASADQVRPLLPGTPSCLVLVTSRSRLLGLVASESAVPITLDPFE